jgi:predicted  nucleic acid-binding Zn-ribbon protein
MKERLKLLYELNKIDKELQELDNLRGDIPQQIEELESKKREQEEILNELKTELAEIEVNEKKVKEDNEALTSKIDKNDNLLRAGAVKTNQEYNALAKEIEDAYEKMGANDNVLNNEINVKKGELTEKINTLQTELDVLTENLNMNKETLTVLNEQTEEEEHELKKQRDMLVPGINPDDLEYYEQINRVKFGDSMAIVRKGSCLGCFNSIPPQRVIEIKMAEHFFHCESCGRILISEEFIDDQP